MYLSRKWVVKPNQADYGGVVWRTLDSDPFCEQQVFMYTMWTNENPLGLFHLFRAPRLLSISDMSQFDADGYIMSSPWS